MNKSQLDRITKLEEQMVNLIVLLEKWSEVTLSQSETLKLITEHITGKGGENNASNSK